MKFEEILPKMRDEGRIGKIEEEFFKLEDGIIWRKSAEHLPWSRHPEKIENYLMSSNWSLEPIKVKQWLWVFGVGNEGKELPLDKLTEAEAECYRIKYKLEWMERIEHTMAEEEE